MIAQETKEVKQMLLDMWASDPVLVSTWHIAAPASLEECIERTMQDLAGSNTKVFKILDGNTCVGFFGCELSNYLNLFFIHPSYRTKKYVSQIWPLISSHFPSPFYTAVYAKNTPAINFYSRNGRILDDSEHYKTFILRSI